ncbi:uncharacterized protein BO96DRAFT_430928 [Aspergillus niger CBS 101883]|uniref:uncharacterized protein n=1 Tax=Aspergillus lacticoffeatus (strain CBS 101883) TaxID=1450533 RepID=UPI000D7F409E|nr:uncharacterized protein BO96DRAFT_430928 [Aspergillus niger CBS 101883]PYH59824.1 hypothetical protein BO96DRAFT_430928 [Aspergillus niger CBS 101883]
MICLPVPWFLFLHKYFMMMDAVCANLQINNVVMITKEDTSFEPLRLLLHTTLPFYILQFHSNLTLPTLASIHFVQSTEQTCLLDNPQNLQTSPRIYNISAKPLFNMSIPILSDSMPRLSSMQLSSSPSPHLPKYRTQHYSQLRKQALDKAVK